MGDDLPDTLTSSIQQPWGRLVSCLVAAETIDISQPSFKIGRGDTCDVVLNAKLMELNDQKSSVISKEHCLLTKETDNKFYITDLSKNGTYVNGRNIGKKNKVALRNNDKIGCCNATFYIFQSLLTEPELPNTLTLSVSSSLSLTPKVQVIHPWGRLIACLLHLKSLDICNRTFKVGRAPYCDAVIEEMDIDPKVKAQFSKEQFILVKDPDVPIIYIKDLSRTGTYLNGRLIGNNCQNILQPEDKISIGPRKKLVYFYKSMHPSNMQYLPENLRKKYELCHMLGKGACGEVRLAYEKVTCRMYAIKNILKSRSTTSQIHELNHPSKIRTEVNILKALSHPFVIRMKDIEETEDAVFIVLEYMRGGELSNRILSTVPLTEANVKFLFYQIALAVHYLHCNGIAHRDLKPQNVLLSTDDVETLVKVSDFGLSKVIEGEDMMQTRCGTYSYVAPEVLDNRFKEYDKKVDVWSLGVILYYMLSKDLPFKSDQISVLCDAIKRGVYIMEEAVWNGVSFQARHLVRRMLTVDPEKRITIDEILKHPWLEKDVAMQYRVQSLVDAGLENVPVCCDLEPPAKRTRLSSGESTD